MEQIKLQAYVLAFVEMFSTNIKEANLNLQDKKLLHQLYKLFNVLTSSLAVKQEISDDALYVYMWKVVLYTEELELEQRLKYLYGCISKVKCTLFKDELDNINNIGKPFKTNFFEVDLFK